MFLRLLLLAAAAIAVVAQPRGSGVISGLVMSRSTGEPVRKAVITLTWRGTPICWATAQSDASGRFTFSGLPAGAYEIRAGKDGMGSAIWGAESMSELGKMLALRDNEQRTDVVLRLVRPASISGVVLDADGDSLTAAQVSVFVEGYPRGKKDLVPRGSFRTNDRGEYRISNLPPGRYYVFAGDQTPMGYAGSPGMNSNRLLLPQFYGGSQDWKRVAPLVLASGSQMRGIDFRLTSSPTVVIRGKLSGLPDGAPSSPPAPGAPGQQFGPQQHVSINIARLSDDNSRHQTMSSGAGPPDYAFRFENLAPGTYELTAMYSAENKTWWAVQKVEAQSEMETSLTLAPATELKGQVQAEGEAAQAGPFTVNLTRGDVRMQGRFGGGAGGANQLMAKTGPDGKFTIGQVPPGVWDIGVSPIPKGGYLKSMHLGKQDVLTEEMVIGPGTDLPLNIVVSARGARVEGTIQQAGQQEGKDPKRLLVLLAPTGKFRAVMSFFAVSGTDTDGKFQLTGITPGKYKLFAFEQLPSVEFRNPDLVDKLSEFGQNLDIAEGVVLKAEPKAITAAQIAEKIE